MLTVEESEFLLQIINSLIEYTKKLEMSYEIGNLARAKQIKISILKMQSRIDEIIGIKKR